jgi:hypothetical protein
MSEPESESEILGLQSESESDEMAGSEKLCILNSIGVRGQIFAEARAHYLRVYNIEKFRTHFASLEKFTTIR